MSLIAHLMDERYRVLFCKLDGVFSGLKGSTAGR